MPEIQPAQSGVTLVRSRSVLIPLGQSEGAILVWVFDAKPGATQALMVRLTEDEADLVYSADPYSVGLLEPVRRRLEENWAVLAVKCGATFHARPYEISRRSSEEDFIADLDQAADSCPVFSVEGARDAPAVEEFARGVARELAFA